MSTKEPNRGVACPKCGTSCIGVSDSRPAPSVISGADCIRRRRKCEVCGEKFTTQEVPVEDIERIKEVAFRSLRQSQLEKAMPLVGALIRLGADEKEPEAFDALIGMISELKR